jgi:hypothetical protein
MSTESSASAVLMRNSWEDKFFSTLMLGDANSEGVAGGGNSATQPLSDAAVEAALAQAAGIDGTNDDLVKTDDAGLARNTSDSLSSVSTSDMP